MKFSLLIRRIMVLALTASMLLFTIVPDTAFASAPAPNAALGTPATADMPEDLSGVEFLSKYEKSFEYCPETLETVLNPQSRVIPAIPAVIYVLIVILAACGIYISFKDDIISIFTSFESWLRANYGDNASVMTIWNDILVGATAATIVGMKTFIPIFKKYLNSSLDGYGTDTPDFSLASFDLFSPVLPELSALAESRGLNYFFTFKCWNTKNTRFDTADIYLSSGSGIACAYYVANGDYRYMYFLDNNQKPVSLNIAYVMSDSTGIEIRRDTDFTESASCFLYARTFGESLTHFPFKVFVSLSSANDYISTGNINGLAWDGFGSVSITADKTWSDLQTKDDATNIEYGDTLTIPAAQEAMNQLLAALAAAESAKAAAEALAPSITVTDTSKPAEGEDDEAQKLPWFPAISKWLTGIQAGVDSLGEQISTFPQTMADIKDSILSIPGEIADFFTLDMTAVSDSFASLQDTFKARFGGIAQLGSIFQKSYSLDMVIPVFSVKVPPELSQLFPDKTEIVIMDLRPYKEQFLWARTLLVAMFYVAFAKWLLDQFDVKLNVG